MASMKEIPLLYRKFLETARRCEEPGAGERNRRLLCEDVSRRFRLNMKETERALHELQRMGQAQRINQRKVRLP